MAAIDKTYLKWEDYLILKEWCENTEFTYDNEVKGSPMDFLYLFKEPYEGEAPVWNTPTAFDKWLYHNCPLEFIQNRLKEQYGNNPDFETPSYKVGTHYRIIENPKYKWRSDKVWYLDFITPEIFLCGWDSGKIYHISAFMPPEICSVNGTHTKNLTKRKLNRLVKNWKLPIGTKVRISNRYIGTKYMIEIC